MILSWDLNHTDVQCKPLFPCFFFSFFKCCKPRRDLVRGMEVALLSWKMFYWKKEETCHKGVSSTVILQTLWTTPSHYILFSTRKESNYMWLTFAFKVHSPVVCCKWQYSTPVYHRGIQVLPSNQKQKKGGQLIFFTLLPKILKSHFDHSRMYHHLHLLASIVLQYSSLWNFHTTETHITPHMA